MSLKSRNIIRTVLIVIVLLSNISCDQLSKRMVRKHIHYDAQIELITNHVTLTRVENSGAFLSLGNALPAMVKFIVLSLLPLMALLYGLVFVFRTYALPRLSLLAFCFVIGGGIGNIYDRIVYGSVTDFLHIDFVLFETGIFNMADVSIMVGILLILITLLRKPRVLI
ncbi:MAG TPA: signal peptidase II [Ohtaekwangia sp.]|nr:signal peptidase II [Ohtaekwangia sp.]